MKKILLTTGGTGGHIFPMLSLYQKLKLEKQVRDVKIITDQRAKKYLDIKNLKIIKSDSPFRKKGIFHFLKTLVLIFFSTLDCLFFLIIYKPNIIVGSGGYVSVPVLIASIILRKKFLLYETNAVLGRVNKLFLPYCEKIFSGYENIKYFPKKNKNKFFYSGQLIRKDFFKKIKNNFSKKIQLKKNNKNILKILVLGGSQGAKVFGEKLPLCFKILNDKNIKFSITQQIQKRQLTILKKFYKKNNIMVQLFEFKKNIVANIQQADIVICRSGSSTLAELVALNKPFIAIPFPSSLDNHQYYNALHFLKKECCWIVDEENKDFDLKVVKILQDIYNSNTLLEKKISNLMNLKKEKVIEKFIPEILKYGSTN